MAQQSGTNLFDGAIANGGTVDHALTNPAGDYVLVRSTVANIPSAVAGYAVGCILQATDSGNSYVNTGTKDSCTFTVVTNFTLPATITDGSTTTGTALGLVTGVTTGTSFAITGASTTTGKGVQVTLDALTTGSGVVVSSASTSSSARSLIKAVQTGAGATGTSLFGGTQVVQSTHFYKILTESASGVTLWFGDGTTGQGNLSGTAGDILFNGGSHKPEYCTGTTNWTALV